MTKKELPMALREFQEVDHNVVLHAATGQQFLTETREALNTVLNHLHLSELLKPGEQITLPVDSDCGFEGNIILQVRNGGSCGLRDVKPESPESTL